MLRLVRALGRNLTRKSLAVLDGRFSKEACQRLSWAVSALVIIAASVPAFAGQLTVTVKGIEQNAGSTWDSGTLTVIVNNHSETFSYGKFSTNASVAAGIAARFAQDCGSSIDAKAVGNAITFVTRQAGGPDVEINASVEWNTTIFAQASFGIDLPAPQGGSGPTVVSLYPQCTPNPVPAGTAVRCAAQLPAGPSGTVSFSLDGTLWSTATVDPSTGLAVSDSLPSITSGPHSVLESYSGDSNYLATSATFSPLTGLNNGSLPLTTIYSYNISTYQTNGNIQAYTDSVNGNWGMSYDNLNRLAMASSGPYGSAAPTSFLCWSYDSFGNMKQQYTSPSSFSSLPGQSCSTPPIVTRNDMSYTDGSNRIAAMNTLGPMAAPGYDGAGNMTNDLHNTYLYDADGHICAMQGPGGFGIAGAMTGYLYNAEGQRVAKGTITSMSCDPATNGFQIQSNIAEMSILGPDGSEITKVDGQGNWMRTNVSAGGQTIATYKNDGLGVHFLLSDWLGTLRVQTDYLGQPEEHCQSQPFGDGMNCMNASLDASGLHFTGKERDTESGLDYFGARYYASSVGRFTSPDVSVAPVALQFSAIGDPQSLNLYSYTENSPLDAIDTDGHECWVVLAGINSPNGRYSAFLGGGAAANSVYYPYSGTNMLTGALGVLGGSGDTKGALAFLNQFKDEPGGVDLYLHSGGAQTGATIINHREFTNVASITYMSPGMGPAGPDETNVMPSTPDVATFHGTGVFDHIATLFSLGLIRGGAAAYSEHGFKQAWNSTGVQERRNAQSKRGSRGPCGRGSELPLISLTLHTLIDLIPLEQFPLDSDPPKDKHGEP